MADRWAKWEKTRTGGQRRFVWRFGVLTWGGIMALVFSARYAYSPSAIPWWVGVPLNVALFGAGGYIWGKWMWAWMERKYLAERAKRGD